MSRWPVFDAASGLQLAYHETLAGTVVHRFTVTELSLSDPDVEVPGR